MIEKIAITRAKKYRKKQNISEKLENIRKAKNDRNYYRKAEKLHKRQKVLEKLNKIF